MTSVATGPPPTLTCPGCGTENPADLYYCVICQTALVEGTRFADDAARGFWIRRAVRLSVLAVAAATAGLFAYLDYSEPFRIGPPASTIAADPTPGNWPMYQREPTHSGFAGAADGALAGTVRWRLDTDKPFHSSPAVVDGTVYASTGDWRVIAVDAATGALGWEHPVTGPVDSSPAVAGGYVFVGLRDGRMLAINRTDGSLHWEFDTGEPVYASPTVHDGVLYIGSGSRKLFSLDAVTGEVRWEYRMIGRVATGAAIHNGVVAVIAQDHRLYIADLVTGRHRLELLRFDARGSPAIDEHAIYVADNRGLLRAMDWSRRQAPLEQTARRMRTQFFIWGFLNRLPRPKDLQWVFFQRGERFVGSPALAFDLVYVGSRSGNLFAVDRTTGEGRWTFAADHPITTAPAVSGDTVYVGDKGGTVYGVDAHTGELKMRFLTDGEVISTPVPANGMLFVTTAAGSLYAIE